MEISHTEENYLKAIFSIAATNDGAGVSTNQLSDHLNNKAASVTDMLKRLSDKKLINYQKYKPVELTGKGEKLAVKIIRKHRLWEVFLLEKLRFKWDEVHDIAEQLEHIQSDELIDRLDHFLGKPKYDPHGDPIPDSNGQFLHIKAKPLSQFHKKGNYILMGVCEHSKAFLQHLSSIGLKIGDIIQVEAINEFDNSYTVKAHKNPLFLSSKVASNILVEVKK
jgi:DtxR family Mn-dependent transcriptional regulator